MTWEALHVAWGCLAAVNLATSLYVLVVVWRGNRTIRDLGKVTPRQNPLPHLTVVVAARNEERDVADGLRSLLAQDYEPLKILIVNDRSTDRTGEILDQLAAEYPQLEVVHIRELPAGWLGKNHALHYGAARASGELLLFTDADVVMQPTTLRRAVTFLEDHRIDHLTMMFRVCLPGWLLKSCVLVFTLYFWAWFRPWKVSDPRSSAYVGAGGFNLLRLDAYRQIGTYEAIRMRPDDDIKLGKLVKQHGLHQEILMATDWLVVPWYRSVGELVRGLEKNAFSGVDYNVLLTVGSSLLVLTFHVLPFVAVFFSSGWVRLVTLAVVVVLWLTALEIARLARFPRSCALGFPLAALLFAYIQWRTMLLNLCLGGLRWRDTFYPLAELKANKV